MATSQEQIDAAKKAYDAAKKAGDKAGMDNAQADAEAARATMGYSGGVDGSQTIVTDQDKYKNYINSSSGGSGGGDNYEATDNSDLIREIFEEQQRAERAALIAARDQTNSDYNQQIKDAPKTFMPKRDAVDVSTVRNIQRANEVSAAKGTTFTGGVQSDQGAMVASGEAQKTALSQQEINLVQSLKKAIADNNKATSMKMLEMNAQNMAAMNAALLNESNRVGDTNFNRAATIAGLTGNLNGTRTLAGQSLDQSMANDAFNRTITEANLTGEYNGKPTLAASQWLKTFDYQKERDKVADGQWLKVFEQNKADASAARAIQWGNLKLNRDQFEWSKDPTNPDNISKVASAAANGNKAYEDTFKKAWDMIGATKKEYDPNTGSYVDKPMYTQEDVARLILNSGLDPKEQDRLANSLGLK